MLLKNVKELEDRLPKIFKTLLSQLLSARQTQKQLENANSHLKKENRKIKEHLNELSSNSEEQYHYTLG